MPVYFDEASDGDLPAGFVFSDLTTTPPLGSPLFVAGEGINIIKGSFGGGSAVQETADVDSFGLHLSLGQILESAVLEWQLSCTECPAPGNSGILVAWISRTTANLFRLPDDTMTGPLDLTGRAQIPQARPVDLWFRTGFAASVVPEVTYAWTFTVVPAPAGVWLLGTGIAGLITRKLRQAA